MSHAPDLDTPVAVTLNALGLRDAAPDDARPYRLLVMGGAHVWGSGVEAEARFTDRLKAAQPQWDVVNAGVSGYSTDQSMLLARRLVPALQPTALALVLDPSADRAANVANVLPDGRYKPHFVSENGTLVAQGQPVPKAVQYREDALPNARIVRLLVDGGTRLLHPGIVHEDPTTALLLRFREEVGRVGVSFFVLLTGPDREAQAALDAAGIPWTLLGADSGADFAGWHWTPAGHAAVASRLRAYFGDHLAGWNAAATG